MAATLPAPWTAFWFVALVILGSLAVMEFMGDAPKDGFGYPIPHGCLRAFGLDFLLWLAGVMFIVAVVHLAPILGRMSR